MLIVGNQLENIILWIEKKLERYVLKIDIQLMKLMNGLKIIEILQRN
jgi:hypothetical protein